MIITGKILIRFFFRYVELAFCMCVASRILVSHFSIENLWIFNVCISFVHMICAFCVSTLCTHFLSVRRFVTFPLPVVPCPTIRKSQGNVLKCNSTMKFTFTQNTHMTHVQTSSVANSKNNFSPYTFFCRSFIYLLFSSSSPLCMWITSNTWCMCRMSI